MSQAASPAAPAPERADDLHVVLFGLPAAGKTSLLGALAQAAQVQEHLLHGQLTDRTHGLAELRQRTYDEPARRTAEEVAPYPVEFVSFDPDGPGPDKPVGAVLIDCDGRVANDLLVRRETLEQDSPEGTLAREVADADALVLVIDASAPPEQVEADFTEFDQFLRRLERARGRKTEVTGLPVFLVLTKCDLLARPADTPADWMERIEQRKRDVDARFRAFLARKAGEGSPFGRIDLHVWATAIKRPALASAPAKPREPYGVAELFRQCLGQAEAFRRERERSRRRLLWTVGIAGVLLLGTTGLSVGLYVDSRLRQTTALERRVESVRAWGDRPGAAERLRAPVEELRAREADLEDIRADPQFGSLRAPLRQFVEDRLRELHSYLAYLQRLRQEPAISSARSEEDLARMRERLETELALPDPEWADTDAGKLRAQRLEGIAALGKAADHAHGWYQDRTGEATRLWTFASYKSGPGEAGIDWQEWSDQVEKLLSARPPFGEDEEVPGSSIPLTYGSALRFGKVLEARAGFETDKARLKRVLDLASALGLAPASDERPAVLVLPRDVSLAGAKARLGQLKKAYPRYQAEFTLAGLPDAVVPKVRQVARTNYRTLLAPGRAEVLRHWRGAGKDAGQRWGELGAWLTKGPEELRDWRQLATLLARLQEAGTEDPVSALASFLGRKEFPIKVRQLTLEVPRRLRLVPREDEALLVYHKDPREPALALKPAGTDHTSGARRYRYRLADTRQITYEPGDSFSARLALEGAGRVLVWSDARTDRYQFECLLWPPRLQDGGAIQDGVRLVPDPADGVPRVPDLLPDVRAEK